MEGTSRKDESSTKVTWKSSARPRALMDFTAPHTASARPCHCLHDGMGAASHSRAMAVMGSEASIHTHRMGKLSSSTFPSLSFMKK